MSVLFLSVWQFMERGKIYFTGHRVYHEEVSNQAMSTVEYMPEVVKWDIHIYIYIQIFSCKKYVTNIQISKEDISNTLATSFVFF
jgi:hypothetical protein